MEIVRYLLRPARRQIVRHARVGPTVISGVVAGAAGQGVCRPRKAIEAVADPRIAD